MLDQANPLLDIFRGYQPDSLTEEENQDISEMPEANDIAEHNPFYDNLAEELDQDTLNKISNYLCDAIEEDAQSRNKLLDAADKVLKYSGINDLEDLLGDGGDSKVPPNTLRTFDSTFLSCLIRSYSDAVSQLFPMMGPCGVYINGEKDQWGQTEETASICRDFINYYLTIKDEGYYPDAKRATLYTIFYGSGFKKIYHDPNSTTISRFISPRKFIINSECSSILESDRITQELDLSKRDILRLMSQGIYKDDLDLPYLKGLTTGDSADEVSKLPGQKLNENNARSYRGQFPWYECHCYLNLKDFTEDNPDKYSMDVPLPYVVTIDKTTKKIASLRRNWKEEDEDRDRIEMFEVSNYMQGFGIYGMGLLHIIGSNAITLTKILRLLVDAGMYQNLPSGFCGPGMKTANKQQPFAPGELREVQVAGGSIKDFFTPLPFNGPSPGLVELYKMMIEDTRALGSIADMGITDTQANVSPITAFGIMDHVSKPQSVAISSLRFSLGRELQMIWEVLKDTIEYEKFTFGQKAQEITKDHFIDEVSIIPVAEPEMNSRMHKMMKVQSLSTIAGQFPGLFKQEEIARKMLDAMGMNTQDIDDVMYSQEELAQIQASQPQAIDPNMLTKMDIEQRAQDSDNRVKIAEGTQAAAIFKTQLDSEIAAAKMQVEKENSQRKEREAEIKAEVEQQMQMIKQAMEQQNRQWEKELALLKINADMEKAEMGLEETELKIEADKDLAEYKLSGELVKQHQEKTYENTNARRMAKSSRLNERQGRPNGRDDERLGR